MECINRNLETTSNPQDTNFVSKVGFRKLVCKDKLKINKSCRPSLDDIAEEWSQVPVFCNKNGEMTEKVSTMMITVDEAFCYLRSSDLPSVENTHNVPDRIKWREMLHWLRAPPKLDPALKAEYNLVLAIAQCGFNWSDSVHWRMMQTVYKKLTGGKLDCPQYGSHWQQVGFQGNDPSTDLRGVGMLGLLQMLYLTTNSETCPLSLKLYCIANSETQPFPLAVLSLNVSNIALNALRAGRLNKECNMRHAVFDVVNLFYSVIINYIYTIWTVEHKSLKDSGILLKDAERHCNKHIRRLIRELPEALSKYK